MDAIRQAARRTRPLRSLPAAALAALALALATASLTRAFDAGSAPPPFSSRCTVTIRAHEDGSAALFCRASGTRFGTVDAETGRVRIRPPR